MIIGTGPDTAPELGPRNVGYGFPNVITIGIAVLGCIYLAGIDFGL